MRVLVLAKSAVPGRVKTRLGRVLGHESAAGLAADCLLDTIDACEAAGASGHLCLDGDLADAPRGTELRRALLGWTITEQSPGDLATRLVRAHADAGHGLVVQVGMDTPQLGPAHLRDAAAALEGHDAVLGAADDGGWWVLARRDPAVTAALRGVPMSTPTTYDDTRAALVGAGHAVAPTARLCDVDTVEDAHRVAALAPHTRFARSWSRLVAELGGTLGPGGRR